MLRPLVALAYVDRGMDRRVLDIFVMVPLVRRVFVLMLMLLLTGRVVEFPLHRARNVEALLFARHIREVGRCALPGGYW